MLHKYCKNFKDTCCKNIAKVAALGCKDNETWHKCWNNMLSHVAWTLWECWSYMLQKRYKNVEISGCRNMSQEYYRNVETTGWRNVAKMLKHCVAEILHKCWNNTLQEYCENFEVTRCRNIQASYCRNTFKILKI